MTPARPRPARAVLALLLAASLVSCAGNPAAYRDIDAGVLGGRWDGALAALSTGSARRSLYPSRNAVLYRLDRGMIEHYAGRYADSSRDLEEGERAIEAAFTKSISQEAATYLANDNARDYPGEDFEDVYINVFNALNYYHRNDLEGALVEIRRVNEKLRYLADKYERARDKVVDAAPALAGEDYAGDAVASRFSNSALARYLGTLLYRARGLADDARIDLGELKRAYALAPAVYPHAPPASVDGELAETGPGMGRLNILAFTGLSPVKVEDNTLIPLPLPPPNNRARLALPRMEARRSLVTSVGVEVTGPAGGAGAAGPAARFNLELLEDLGRVAQETFRSKYGLTVLKTAARMVIKSTVAAGIQAGVSDQFGEGWGLLTGLVGAVAAGASEGADLRAARYFPGRASVGAVNLPAGTYAVTVTYHGRAGVIATEFFDTVTVASGRLNLIECVCLR